MTLLKRHTMAKINTSITAEDIIIVIRKSKIKSLSNEDGEILTDILNYYDENKKFKFTLTDQEINYLSRNNISTWTNYIIYRYKFKIYPVTRKRTKFPVHLLIELSSACNLRCVMCFQSDSSFQKAGKYIGTMSMSLYKKIIDEAYEGGTKAITFASRGEPLYHQEIDEALQYVKGKFTEIKINTNAMLLNEKRSHAILKNCENLTLVFSVDAHSKDLYEKIRVRGNFDKVLSNIRRFIKIKNTEYPNAKVVTRVSGVILSSEQNLEELTNFWKKEVDEVSFEKVEQMSDTYNNEISKVSEPCNFLWENMYIWFDGKCNPCDLDYKSKLEFGNVTKATIQEIWNGRALDELRENHLKGNRTKITPCDRCGVDFSLN